MTQVKIAESVAPSNQVVAQPGESLPPILRAIPDLIFRMARDGTYLDAHVPPDAILAAPPLGPGGFLGRRVSDVLADERARLCMEAIERACTTSTPQTYEYRVPPPSARPDQPGRCYDVRVLPLCSPSGGAPEQVLCLVRDITEAKRRTEQAAQVARRFEMLVRHTSLGMIEWDASLRIIDWNPGAERLFRVPRDLATRELFGDGFIHATHRAEFAELLRAVAAGPKGPTVRQAVRLRDGSEVYGEWQFTRLVDEAGQFVGIVAIVHDHTDRRRAEQIIERDRHLFMSGPVVGVRWLPMPGWPVDFVTQNIDRFGYSPEQFGLNRLMFADLVHPDDLPRILGEVTSYIAAGASSFTQQYRFRDASGQYRWLEDITIVVRDDTGAVKHLDGFLTDATQRINAELALARSRERYEKLVNTIEGIVWEGNPESGRLTFMSNQSEWILGFPADRFVNEPGFWNSRIHPEDRDWIREFCLEQSRLKRDHQLEFRAIDADGSLVWLRNYVTVVDEPDHSYLRGIIVDITKLKHTEAALAQSREQLERAQAVAHVGSWIWDLDGSDRLTWSRQTFRIFGVDESAFTGHESFFVNMLFPEDRPAVRAAFAAAYDGGPRYSVDHRIIRADGQVRWVHQEADIVWNADGSPRQAIGVVKDITEHRAAIEALQASEARFRRVAESNLIGLCFCDAHGVITYANRVFHDMLGHSHADGSAARLNWPDLSPPDDRAADEEAFAELKRTGHSRVYAKELLRRDGSRVPVLVGMAYLDDSRSQVVRFVLDITDRRHAEQWQSFMMAELDHRVKNNMAAVLTLAEQTLRSDLPAVEAGKVLLGRLRALARTHGALAHTHWQGARLLPLAQHALEAFRGVDLHDIRIEGDDVLLPSRVATVLAMALHELATNALKYGALSVPDGRILLRWHIADPDAARTLHLLWEESGGPVVAAPRRRGFGRELIEGGITYECHGSVSLQFLPTGVRCHVQVPLADPSQHRIITRPRDLSPHRL